MWNSWGNMWGGGFGFGLGWIFMFLFWGLIIWAIIALVRGGTGYGNRKEHGEKTALDMLKERYAKGEISREEFEEKKKDLI
jgi:putative membrane protein